MTNIVRHAVQLSNTDTGTIYEFDERRQIFVNKINYGMSAEIIEALRVEDIFHKDIEDEYIIKILV